MPQKIEITSEQLIAHFESTLGLKGATALIERILLRAGYTKQSQFNAVEMTAICALLAMEKGFIATTANILLARMRLRCWDRRANQLLEMAADEKEAATIVPRHRGLSSQK